MSLVRWFARQRDRRDRLFVELVCAGIADGGVPLEDEGDLVTLYEWLLDLGATPQPRSG